MVSYTNYWRVILIKIDLHIHSSLSACGDDELAPSCILKEAEEKGINLISITDHNTILHSLLACQINEKGKVKVVPGVELTSREEVHLLAYFDDIYALQAFGRLIEGLLPDIENNAELFGYQVIYDKAGEIIQVDSRLRQVALNMSLDELILEIHKLKGLAVPAHIDKERFSLTSQLGFLDEEASFDAVEVSKYYWYKNRLQLGDIISGFPVICGSDSHHIDDIGLFFMQTENEEMLNWGLLKKYLINMKLKNENHC